MFKFWLVKTQVSSFVKHQKSGGKSTLGSLMSGAIL